MKNFLAGLGLVILLASCRSAEPVTDYSNNSLYSTLWIQTAAEYEALSHQAYNTSQMILPLALEDSTWTASLEQGEEYGSLPPAIILDVDETVLDNSYYEARGVIDKTGYDSETWNAWVREMKAEALKGAVDLTTTANDLGIAVFYITNRSAEVQAATVENLRQEGFPVDDGSVMSNGGRPDWTSAKTARRQLVADDHRVLMLFGDDLNDFLPARGLSIDERKRLVEEHNDKWGYKWFVFPNPNYGSWERALYRGDEESAEERQETRLERLETKRDQ
jgi:acid phosphatase